MATKTPTPPLPVETTAARVLAAITIGDVRYQPGDVIEDIPVPLTLAYADALDPHPEAVAHALSIGAPVMQFSTESAHENQS